MGTIKTADDLISIVRAITICAISVIMIIALCLTLFFKNYADPTVLITITTLTGTVIGYLAGKRSVSGEPIETTVVNPPTEPVPTANVKSDETWKPF
jgi:hypothetical protein